MKERKQENLLKHSGLVFAQLPLQLNDIHGHFLWCQIDLDLKLKIKRSFFLFFCVSQNGNSWIPILNLTTQYYYTFCFLSLQMRLSLSPSKLGHPFAFYSWMAVLNIVYNVFLTLINALKFGFNSFKFLLLVFFLVNFISLKMLLSESFIGDVILMDICHVIINRQ